MKDSKNIYSFFNRGFTPLEVNKLKNKFRHQGLLTGFTLVEILVYAGVLGLVVGILVSFIYWTIYSNSKSKVMRETMDNARRAMEVMAYEIKEAKSVYTPTTTQNQLSLETLKYLPDGETSSFIDFYICENRLCVKKESQDPIVLISDNVEVAELAFTRAVSGNLESIKIDLTINYKNPTGAPQFSSSFSATSNIALRVY